MFTMKLCHKVFIECFSVIHVLPDFLSEEEGLGAHTSVVFLSPSIGIRYFWCNRAVCLCGDKVSLQCPKCLAIKTLKMSGAFANGSGIVMPVSHLQMAGGSRCCMGPTKILKEYGHVS